MNPAPSRATLVRLIENYFPTQARKVHAANSPSGARCSVVSPETKNLRRFSYRRRLIRFGHWNLEPVLKMGGAGDSPAPVGDPPTGTAASNVARGRYPLVRAVAPIPSGESPDRTGGSPVLPANHFSNTRLLRSLINPGTEQADLLLGQRGILVALFRGGHFHILHQLGDVSDHWALGAVAGDDGRVAALAAFDHRHEAVHAVLALWLLAAVAFDAGLLEQRLDVLLERQAFLVRRRR